MPEIGKVYGAIHGIRGILDGQLMDFSEETPENLELVAGTPSSALLSVRLSQRLRSVGRFSNVSVN